MSAKIQHKERSEVSLSNIPPGKEDDTLRFIENEEKGTSIEKEGKETSMFLEGDSKELEEKENKSKTKILATIGIAILFVFLLALNIITAYYWTTERRNGRGDTTLCLNCSLIKLHPEDDLSSFAVYEPNTCCLKEGGNYSQIVDKVSGIVSAALHLQGKQLL